jgi:hypothetical protein
LFLVVSYRIIFRHNYREINGFSQFFTIRRNPEKSGTQRLIIAWSQIQILLGPPYLRRLRFIRCGGRHERRKSGQGRPGSRF